MGFSTRLQVLTCLMLYASCAHAIMVKFGTKGGPIEPPPPESTVAPQPPFRTPAPVWEERSNDAPDPNAQWRPQLFIPQPRFTQIVYTYPSAPPTLSNAQRFVNAYRPQNPQTQDTQNSNHQPIKADPIKNYFTPAQILSSQSLPGFGIRYFLPDYLKTVQPQPQQQQNRQEDAYLNQIDSNDFDPKREAASDVHWQYEKDASKRPTRNTIEITPIPYQWPAFVAHQ